jgi:hypothetical protein
MVYDDAREAEVVAPEKLAAELGGYGYETRLLIPAGHANEKPSLEVINPHARVLTDRVYVERDAYWWSWAERLGPVEDLTAASEAVRRVLSTGRSST